MTDRAEFQRLFATARTSLWRLETQGEYREPDEVEPFRRFLAGEPDDLAWFTAWLSMVRGWAARGCSVGRVRVLTDPVTDYLRWEMAITPSAVNADEDIRFLGASTFAALGIPYEDFWIFDNDRVALMFFGDGGVAGAELITEPARVAEYRERRDVVLQHTPSRAER